MKNVNSKVIINKQKGITLIALVITIIVLLILAGVTLNMVIGQNGIFNKATTAKEETKQQTILEAWNLLNAESTLYKQTGKEGLEEEIIKSKLEEAGITFGENSYPTWEEFKKESTITIKEKTLKYAELYIGGEVYTTTKINVGEIAIDESKDSTVTGKNVSYSNPKIPVGFKATNEGSAIWGTSEGYKNGLVIEDGQGNQFVWIAVDGNNVAIGRYKYEGNFENYSETLNSNWKSKVDEYGGFYIGRYETKYESNKCVIKAGNIPTANITRDTTRGYAQGMKTSYGYTSVTTDLLSSYMWDTTMSYIDYYTQSNFSTTMGLGNAGNLTSGAVKSGSYANDIKCNIADMAGNVREWSTEYYSLSNAPCVPRGGDYSINGQPGRRGAWGTNGTEPTIGFRCALYW